MVVVNDCVLVNISTFPCHVCHSAVCLFNRCYVFRSFVFYCHVGSLAIHQFVDTSILDCNLQIDCIVQFSATLLEVVCFTESGSHFVLWLLSI